MRAEAQRKANTLDPNQCPTTIARAQARLKLIDEILDDAFLERICRHMTGKVDLAGTDD